MRVDFPLRKSPDSPDRTTPARRGGSGAAGAGGSPLAAAGNLTAGQLGLPAMTPYDFAMEEVTLALLRVGDALIVNEPFAIAQECTAARRVYRDMLELYPKLQLRATERDSLLGQDESPGIATQARPPRGNSHQA